jgi:hypothetical protein
MSLNRYHSSLKNAIKQTGRIDDWLQFNGGGYNDSEVIGEYKVEIQNEPESIRMFIWSKSRPCINIYLSLTDYVAVMDGVYYYPGCTINGKMVRGEGTKKMVKFAIDFIKSKGAKEIQLSDRSSIMCNGQEIRLGPMYFLKFGQTWYEKYFGFKPTEKYLEKYEKSKDKLKAGGLYDKPCDYFTDDIVDKLVVKHEVAFFPYIIWSKKL